MRKLYSLALVGIMVFLSGVASAQETDPYKKDYTGPALTEDQLQSFGDQRTKAGQTTVDALKTAVPERNAAQDKADTSAKDLQNAIERGDDKAYIQELEVQAAKDADAAKVASDKVKDLQTKGAQTNPNANVGAGFEAEPGTIGSKSFMFNPQEYFAMSANASKYTEGTKNITTLLTTVINVLMIIIASVAVLLIAAGGMLIATSANSDERLSKGKALITYNVQALGISLSSYLIISFIIWLIGT